MSGLGWAKEDAMLLDNGVDSTTGSLEVDLRAPGLLEESCGENLRGSGKCLSLDEGGGRDTVLVFAAISSVSSKIWTSSSE